MTDQASLSYKQKFLVDFWLDHASPEGWVNKETIRLQALARVSSNLVLLKLEGHNSWRFTLVGTSIVEEYCQDFTGLLVDDIPFHQCREIYNSIIDCCMKLAVPHVMKGDFCYNQNGFLQVKDVAIPVSDNGLNITHILLVCDIIRGQANRALYRPDEPTETKHEIFPYFH